jgi:hypothetical protein
MLDAHREWGFGCAAGKKIPAGRGSDETAEIFFEVNLTEMLSRDHPIFQGRTSVCYSLRGPFPALLAIPGCSLL